MTLTYKLRLLLAFRKFMRLMAIAWAEFQGKPVPPERPSADDDLRDRNERDHGGT